MPYYCKKCGAVVSGKYCSCCGSRATNDLKEFRNELARRKRAFRDTRFRRGSLTELHAADFAWLCAERQALAHYDLTWERFPQISEWAYGELKTIEEKAGQLYEGIMLTVGIVL